MLILSVGTRVKMCFREETNNEKVVWKRGVVVGVHEAMYDVCFASDCSDNGKYPFSWVYSGCHEEPSTWPITQSERVCDKFSSKLKKVIKGWACFEPFLYPVCEQSFLSQADWIRYQELVTTPVHFEGVLLKLRHHQYASETELKNDIDQIWKNARLFNYSYFILQAARQAEITINDNVFNMTSSPKVGQKRERRDTPFYQAGPASRSQPGEFAMRDQSPAKFSRTTSDDTDDDKDIAPRWFPWNY
jgi:hypothetical protein